MKTTGSSRRSALLVIANAESRWQIREQLQGQGFNVFGTGDTTVAMNWLARRRPDVVVSDYLMPGTHMAVTHLVQRRERGEAPCMIGLVEPARQDAQDIRRVLGFDEVLSSATPVVVLTKRVLELVG